MEEGKKVDSEPKSGNSRDGDMFSKIFFFGVPFTIPIIVTLTTYLFYPIVAPYNMVWAPLLLIYWTIIWTYTLLYRKYRGGVFDGERFEPTLLLKGKRVWLQYILNYGPLVYLIPIFILMYSYRMSIAMYVVVLGASIINGPSEEIFWRACLEDAGKNAGVSETARLAFAPVAFGLWHTAFVIHLFPWNITWWISWGAVILMTWISGLIWMWVLQRSGRLIPQSIVHACGNFFSIFPMILIMVLGVYF
ncbi:MAG: CPBP family intramembrane glutamic endopeptidase [Candidatus Helarchaeota archaeon]